jgi:hypothetical protein
LCKKKKEKRTELDKYKILLLSWFIEVTFDPNNASNQSASQLVSQSALTYYYYLFPNHPLKKSLLRHSSEEFDEPFRKP